MYKNILNLFSETEIVRKVQIKLPKLFQIAELESQRAGKVGIGELLRNRCAYLIGSSHQERSNILDDLKKIYHVRSYIVHRGKAKLDTHEQFLLFKLRGMCDRVIRREIELLRRDTEK